MMNPFDIQEWKPTFCKTEEELKTFWEEHQIARGKVMAIRAGGGAGVGGPPLTTLRFNKKKWWPPGKPGDHHSCVH